MKVVEATTDFYNSFIDRNASAACNTMSNNLIAKFTALSGGKDCETLLGETLPKIPDERVQVYEEQVGAINSGDVKIEGGKRLCPCPPKR